MANPLHIDVVMARDLSPALRAEILELCRRAYGEDLEYLYVDFADPAHVLGYAGGKLVSHALWITRWLQAGDAPPMRTACVEMVATDPDCRGQGYATLVMLRLMREIADFEMGALSPADTTLYSRLGWEYWRGPLYIRRNGKLEHTPEDRVMILRLARTPALDLDVPLSVEWRPGEVW